MKRVQANNSIWKNTVTQSQLWDDITLLCLSPSDWAWRCGPSWGCSHIGRRVSLSTPSHLLQQGKMGETEEERDNVGKLFENFVQASTCKGTLQAFNVLCRQLDLDPADSSTFYSSLKEKVTTWKAKALWSKLDKRMSHKEYKKGQTCVGTKVSLLWICFVWMKVY